jgi:hypothetical protein
MSTLRVFIIHPKDARHPPRPLGTTYQIAGRRNVEKKANARKLIAGLGYALRTLSVTASGFVAYVYPTNRLPQQTGKLKGWAHKTPPSGATQG